MTSTELKTLKMKKDESRIPENPSYCYKSVEQSKEDPTKFPITELCPYWRIASDKPDQFNGYCLFIEEGDWEEHAPMVLWDQLKCCGINDELNHNK